MESKSDFKVRGLTQEQKDFLYNYAKKELGYASRSKAILHLINEKMPSDNDFSKQVFAHKNTNELKKRLQFSLRESDYQRLKNIADETDSSIQYYIISLILKDLYNKKRLNGNEIELLRKSNYQLYKIGVNVNQIAKAMNEGEQRTLATEKLAEHINEHIELVKKLLVDSLEKY